MNKTIFNDGTIINHHGKRDHIGKIILKTKQYFEKELLNDVFNRLNNIKFEYIIEIGANIGNHILYYNKYVDYNKMIAFEPLDINFEILKKNIIENKVKNIELKHYGLGPKNSTVDFFVNTRNYGASSINKYSHRKKLAMKTSVKIKSFKKELDFLPDDKNIFMKIDIEGAEKAILDDLIELISNKKLVLMIELRRADYKKAEYSLLKNFISIVSRTHNLVLLGEGDNFIFANKNIDGNYDYVPQEQSSKYLKKYLK